MDALPYDINPENELWDSDFDPAMQEALNLSNDTDIGDWFMDGRDVKLPGVIYQDKLISDALLGCQPIKTEHSYSLNSDGDSIPDSPRSLQNKIDEMDEDYEISINSNMLTIKSPAQKYNNNNDTTLLNHNMLNAPYKCNKNMVPTTTNNCNSISNANIILSATTAPTTANNNIITNQNANKYLNNILSNSRTIPNAVTINCFETESMDTSTVKEEPLSPDSSCPPSPNASSLSSASSTMGGLMADNNHTLIVAQQQPSLNQATTQFNAINVNLANVATYTNSDLVFEHNNKNGTLQLSPASQSLLKSQQIILNGTQQRIVVPKLNIRMDAQSQGFGLPPTPPSSLSSDDSEDNQNAEIHTALSSPSSPSSLSSSFSPNNTQMQQSTISPKGNNQGASPSSRGYNGTSTRQPIHTPLISNQPKGSTGQLELTEEEKRTLIAEGYPIPTRLPLTKSEEKSLKKIRRKIKNKISAQESRRKKKEYMDKLERQVEVLVSENTSYSKRIETLEETNANLISQLAKMQALINRQTSNLKKS